MWEGRWEVGGFELEFMHGGDYENDVVVLS